MPLSCDWAVIKRLSPTWEAVGCPMCVAPWRGWVSFRCYCRFVTLFYARGCPGERHLAGFRDIGAEESEVTRRHASRSPAIAVKVDCEWGA